jgi:hypothetical protein
MLSDKMVVILAVSLDDGTGNIAARRRMLVEVVSDSDGVVHSRKILSRGKKFQGRSMVAPDMAHLSHLYNVAPRTPHTLRAAAPAFETVMSDIASQSIPSSTPTIDYGVDIPKTLTEIQGIAPGRLQLLELSIQG